MSDINSPLKLSNQLCFPLYAAAKAVTSAYRPYLEEYSLTYTQYIALMVMWEKREVSVSELGEAVCLDSGTLSPLIKKLIEKGYISKKRKADDERVVMLSLTQEGALLHDSCAHIPSCMKEKLKHFSEEELKLLSSLLHKVLRDFS